MSTWSARSDLAFLGRGTSALIVRNSSSGPEPIRFAAFIDEGREDAMVHLS